MPFERRVFLTWDETAEVLGMDREGLRQALQYLWSPDGDQVPGPWLPVMVPAAGDGFMARLQFSEDMRPKEFWNGRSSYYKAGNAPTELNFPNGLRFPANGRDGGEWWEASHGYGVGYAYTFAIGGSRLTVSPRSVRHACEKDGYIPYLEVAPHDWCDEGFPADLWFVVVDCDNDIYLKKPTNMYDAARFLREDVDRLLHGRNDAPTAERPLGTRERNNLLRIIVALAKEAKIDLSEGGRGAVQIEAAVASAGFDGPKERSIRETLKALRKVD